MPQLSDIQAEKGVIGAIILEPAVIVEVSSLIDPLDFTDQHCGPAYRACMELYQSNKPIDLITLANALRQSQNGSQPEEGWNEYLFNLVDTLDRNEGFSDHAKTYAASIRSYSLRRKVSLVSNQAANVANDLTTTPEAVLEQVNLSLQNVASWWLKGRSDDYYLPDEDVTELIIRSAAPREKNAAPDKVLPIFGFTQLDGDDYTQPRMMLLRSTLTAIIADTGVGKTSFLDQISVANEERGLNVIFFHNELSNEHMVLRRVARMTGIYFTNLITKNLNDKERGLMLETANLIKGWTGRMDLVFCPGWSAARIGAELKLRNRILEISQGKQYDVFMMDYLQKIGQDKALSNSGASEATQVSFTMGYMADLANELDMAGIIVSQPKREGSASRDEFIKPTLHSGLGSSAIEQRCNQVLGLWRDKKSQEPNCPAEVIGLKSTFGESDWTAPMFYYKSRYEFGE
jgi:replicative DNA helicase